MAAGVRHGNGRITAPVLETGTSILPVMGLLDKANTETYGTPVPTKVTMTIEKDLIIITAMICVIYTCF